MREGDEEDAEVEDDGATKNRNQRISDLPDRSALTLTNIYENHMKS